MRRALRRGLLAKMMLRSAIVLTLALFLVQTISYTTARRQLIRLTEELQEDLSKLYAERCDRFVERGEEDLRVIRELPALREFFLNRQYGLVQEARNHLADVGRYLEDLRLRHPALARVQISDVSGRPLLRLRRDELSLAPIDAAGFGLTSGEMAAGLPSDEIIDLGLVGLEQAGADTDARSALRLRMSLIIDRTYWGEIELDLDLAPLTTEFSRERVWETGFLAIYSSSGQVIHDPGLDVGASLAGQRRALAEAIASAADMTTRTLEAAGGSRQILTLAPAHSRPWFVAAIVPEAEALAGINRTRDLTAILVLASVAVEFLVLLFFTRRLITSPVRKLLAGTRRIVSGDYAHEVQIDTHDEIGELAASFNAMSRSLSSSLGEMRRRGDEVTALNEALERKIAELEVEVGRKQQAQKALVEEQKRLRHAEKMEAVGHLAGGIAHEFNNLLAGIMGYADLLHMDLQDRGDARQQALAILKASRQAAELTSQLLAFSRRGELQIETFDVGEVVRDVGGLIQRAGSRLIEIELELPEERLIVKGDRTRIQGALLNLAINARDAMPNGGRLRMRGTVRTVDEDLVATLPQSVAAGDFVVLEISDTGEGIQDDVLEHIFEPFYTTKGVGRGTGIGLAAVYGTMQSHGGAVVVRSRPGEGSCFTLYFPSAAIGDSREPAGGSRTEATGGGGGPGLVLLVDDEEMLRTLGEKSLGRLGYRVLTARDGQEAVEIFARRRDEIDIILLDAVMPRMGGREALRAIRKMKQEVPVVVCSGYVSDESDWDEPGLGIQGFLNKPFDLESLAAAITAALRGDPDRAPAEPTVTTPASELE